MAPEANPNPALFRLRVFEEQWLEPLRLATTKGSLLDYILAAEAEEWIRIGVAVGYFPAWDQHERGIEAPDASSAVIIKWMRACEPWPELGTVTFAQALEAAREDLTRDRRSLLRLVIFAPEDEWDEAIRNLTSFRMALQTRGSGCLDALATASWALEGDLNESADPLDLFQSHLPAGWRYGPMMALRDCASHAGERIDAVLIERAAITRGFKRIIESPVANIETLVACREAAARQEWGLFDELFRGPLMHDYREYLCETLGAWEETLDLARLADDPSFSAEVTRQPGYYPITVARCLKHLGRSGESRAKYLNSLSEIAHSRDPDTALYVNNFLTLLIWRGELAGADLLAELNFRALSWIVEPWRHRWQVEHGCSSIAYLRLLQGRLDAASVLFDHAAHAWDGYPEDRPWIYDYYPYHRSELILLTDPTAHDAALAAIESLLAVAAAQRWPESICRGHIQAAVVHVDRASRLGDPEGLLLAREHLAQARQITSGMRLPDVAIAYHLAGLKADMTHREVDVLADSGTAELEDTIDHLEALVERSGLALATSEVIAARGVQAFLEGSLKQAHELYDQAVSVCLSQGYALALSSPRSLVSWLGGHVGAPVRTASTGSTINLVELIGSDLSDDWMIARLNALASTS